jgi:anti-sigma factor RsiW
MECKNIEELLSPYLEDGLNLRQREAVEVHLASCPSCSELLSFMKEARISLETFPELEVSQNLMERLYGVPRRKKRFRLVQDFLLRPSLQPILAAATILLTVVSFYAFHPNRSAINDAIERQFHLGISKVQKLYAEADSITHSLDEYKDSFFLSLKNLNPFKGNEDTDTKT